MLRLQRVSALKPLRIVSSICVPRAYSSAAIQKPPLHQPAQPARWSSADKFTTEMTFARATVPLKAYRVMDHTGRPLMEEHDPCLPREQVLDLYKKTIQLFTMDNILYEAQRQGRISFYMTHYGEEAMIGTAAALHPEDVVHGQYREAYMLLYRGFTVDDCANQCFSNRLDECKGRQMPVHYGSKKYSFQTISSPLGTQIPQAAGSAYALKLAESENCSICFFGEGAASEGDFHAGMNMAATLGCPVIFFCRNNGYAISTPASEQYKGDGIASRGIGYGIDTIRIDGNDIWAAYNATKAARAIVMEQKRPVLIESMTYRVGHHSTSDDSTKYRDRKEVEERNMQDNPITRLRLYMQHKGWWDQSQEDELRKEVKASVIKTLTNAEKQQKPAIENMFTDVYDELTPNLIEQKQQLQDLINKYPEYYPTHDFAPS